MMEMYYHILLFFTQLVSSVETFYADVIYPLIRPVLMLL